MTTISNRYNLTVAPRASVDQKIYFAGIGDHNLNIDCLIEAFPRANSYWAKLSDNNSRRKQFNINNIDTTINENEQTNYEENKQLGNNKTISVKQTAINSFTYKLTLSINKVTHNDFGTYVCSSTSALGTSEATIVVSGKLSKIYTTRVFMSMMKEVGYQN